MTCVTIKAMTTTSGTPSNQRMIGIKISIAIDPQGINQINNLLSDVLFQVFDREHKAHVNCELELIPSWDCFIRTTNAKGICHADSHLDCDRRLHDGSGGCSPLRTTAVRAGSLQIPDRSKEGPGRN
jgi:hypothetical protein